MLDKLESEEMVEEHVHPFSITRKRSKLPTMVKICFQIRNGLKDTLKEKNTMAI